MIDNFEELGINNNIIKAINELGFEKPTPVQEVVIPMELYEDSDIVCLAQTGTGKTAAFGLPLIQSLDLEKPETQALILCPTRELCRQIAQDLTKYAKYTEQFSLVAVYGGSNIESQIKALRKGAKIIVATPGRILDLLKRGAAHISNIKKLILDEADEMLNMGFKEELDTILSYCPIDRRTLLFSATLPIEVEGIAKKYMSSPKIITIGKRNQGSDNVKHYFYIAQAKDRYAALKRIVDYNPDMYAIIFCRTRQETQEIADSLIRDGYNAEPLHGDLSQAQRDIVMSRFKKKTLSLLVATDVAARGIDVNNLTHVINYNLPDEAEQYTHRSGRTGRADKTGISISIINTRERSKIKRIEAIVSKPFAQAKIPTGKEVCSKQLFHLIDEIENTEVKGEIEDYMKIIESKWSSMSKEEIIRKVLSVEFNRFLDYYKNSPDLNVIESPQKNDSNSSKNKSGKNNGKNNDKNNGKNNGKKKGLKDENAIPADFSWIEINIGNKNGLTTRHIIRLLTSCGVGKQSIGVINIGRKNCRIELNKKVIPYITEKLNGTKYRGKSLDVFECDK